MVDLELDHPNIPVKVGDQITFGNPNRNPKVGICIGVDWIDAPDGACIAIATRDPDSSTVRHASWYKDYDWLRRYADYGWEWACETDIIAINGERHCKSLKRLLYELEYEVGV